MAENPMTLKSDSRILETWQKTLIEKVMEKLRQRQMKPYFANTREEALTIALELIPDGANVFQGGSMTLEETGIRSALQKEKRFTFTDAYAEGLSVEQQLELRRQGLLSDVFICSSNAITQDGILVNRDGLGNRVSAMIFGPKRVIIVAGINKIVPDIESAILRIDSVATPMNCLRLNRKTPCVKTLECHECQVSDRICAATTIIDWQKSPDRIHVILVAEALGF